MLNMATHNSHNLT